MYGVAVVMMCAYMGLVYSDCTQDAQTYICQEIPQSFPEGLSSLVLIIGDVGEINSSVFHSESLASVTRLTITKAGITNISTGALTLLRNLTTLILDQNSLSQITPSWFSQPAGLKDLSLLQNHIKGLENSMLHGLTGLTSLNLSMNMIRTIAPGSFVSQTHLRRLDLSGNQLTRVDPLVFLPLSSTSIRLDGNPWDCSCGRHYFVSFLRDLQNASLLEKEMEVTCQTPETLKDQPVWNVSKCAISPPTDALIQPAPIAPTAPTMRITVPALIGLIVVLCVLTTAVCAMGMMIYRRKQRIKQVKPTPELEEEEESGGELENTSPREPHQKCTDAEEMIHWDSELVRRTPKTGVRAKSANAVLSTFLFCGDGRDLHKLKTEIEGPSAKPDTSQDNAKKQGVDSEEDTKNSDENTTDKLKMERNEDFISEGTHENDRDAPSTGNGSGNHTQASEDTENVPYLSIGGDPTKPNMDQPNVWHGDYQGQVLQMAGAIVRVSTWPPTSSQWKTRCATQEGRLNLFLVAKPHQEPEVRGDMENLSVDISLEGDTSVRVLEPVLIDIVSPDSERCVEPAEEHQEPDVEPASLDDDPVPPAIKSPDAAEPAIGSAELLSEHPNSTEPPTGYSVLPSVDPPESVKLPVESRQSQLCLDSFETAYTEFEICPEDSEPTVESTEPQSDQVTVSQSTPSNIQSQSQTLLSQAEELNDKPEGIADMSESTGSQNTTMANRGRLQRAQELGVGEGSLQAPPGGSPGDEILLVNNEYGLLHEVVQNHGRWTRERWRQTHQNKLLYKHKGQGH